MLRVPGLISEEVNVIPGTSPPAEFAAARAAGSAGAPVPELAGPRQENLASLARLVAARRGEAVRIEEVTAADPDSEAAADGSLLWRDLSGRFLARVPDECRAAAASGSFIDDVRASELPAHYRRELEHSLRALPEHVAVRVLLQQRLAEVLAEQDSRSRLHEANGQA